MMFNIRGIHCWHSHLFKKKLSIYEFKTFPFFKSFFPWNHSFFSLPFLFRIFFSLSLPLEMDRMSQWSRLQEPRFTSLLMFFVDNVKKVVRLFTNCKVYQGFRLNLGKNNEKIIFVSLLTTFKVSMIFGVTFSMLKTGSCLKPNHHGQVRLDQIPDTAGNLSYLFLSIIEFCSVEIIDSICFCL